MADGRASFLTTGHGLLMKATVMADSSTTTCLPALHLQLARLLQMVDRWSIPVISLDLSEDVFACRPHPASEAAAKGLEVLEFEDVSSGLLWPATSKPIPGTGAEDLRCAMEALNASQQYICCNKLRPGRSFASCLRTWLPHPRLASSAECHLA